MQDYWKNNAAQNAMEETICKLTDGIGGCIRVKSTGLPVAYDDILKTTGFIFFAAGCLAWAPKAGWYNPILVLIVYIIVKMIIGVGSNLVSYSNMIRHNLLIGFVLLTMASLTVTSYLQRSQEDLEMTNLTCLSGSTVKRLTSKSVRLTKKPSPPHR